MIRKIIAGTFLPFVLMLTTLFILADSAGADVPAKEFALIVIPFINPAWEIVPPEKLKTSLAKQEVMGENGTKRTLCRLQLRYHGVGRDEALQRAIISVFDG